MLALNSRCLQPALSQPREGAKRDVEAQVYDGRAALAAVLCNCASRKRQVYNTILKATLWHHKPGLYRTTAEYELVKHKSACSLSACKQKLENSAIAAE